MTEIDQEAYALVRAHLLHQMARSQTIYRSPDGSTRVQCAYRGNGRLKCAIGALIKDEFFDESLNSAGVEDEFVRVMLKQSGWGDVSEELLYGLQRVHDSKDPNQWYGLLPEDPERFFILGV